MKKFNSGNLFHRWQESWKPRKKHWGSLGIPKGRKQRRRGATQGRGDVTRAQGAGSRGGRCDLGRLLWQETTQRCRQGWEGGGKKSLGFSFLLSSNLLTIPPIDQTQVAVRQGRLGDAFIACRGLQPMIQHRAAEGQEWMPNQKAQDHHWCLDLCRGICQVRNSYIMWLWNHHEIQYQPKHQLTPVYSKVLLI